MLNILHLRSPWRALWPRLALPRTPSLAAMRRAAETRRQLAGLDDAALRDIGISRADALMEAKRAPWDLAAPWTGRRV